MEQIASASLLPSLAAQRSRYERVKRTLDLTGGLVAAVTLAPLLLLIAVLIRATSPGPALYCQQRTGRHRRAFRIYKFRTMRPGDSGLNHDASLITPIGRFLRRYHLDELPQVFNIIRGEMSWIGPRPEPVEYADAYALELPGYHDRHAVLPGITGWAQLKQGHTTGIAAAGEKLDRKSVV